MGPDHVHHKIFNILLPLLKKTLARRDKVTVSYDEIKQKVVTQANDYHRVKAYTP